MGIGIGFPIGDDKVCSHYGHKTDQERKLRGPQGMGLRGGGLGILAYPHHARLIGSDGGAIGGADDARAGAI